MATMPLAPMSKKMRDEETQAEKNWKVTASTKSPKQIVAAQKTYTKLLSDKTKQLGKKKAWRKRVAGK